MSVIQQLFAVFYAVLFGAMLSSLRGFVAFPWGQALSSLSCALRRFYGSKSLLCRYRRYIARLLLSIIVLNVLPILMFAGYFRLLGRPVESVNQLSLWRVMLVALSALGVYAPYRLWHAIITCGLSSNCFYLRHEVDELVKDREMGPSSLAHLLAACCYAAASFGSVIWLLHLLN